MMTSITGIEAMMSFPCEYVVSVKEFLQFAEIFAYLETYPSMGHTLIFTKQDIILLIISCVLVGQCIMKQ